MTDLGRARRAARKAELKAQEDRDESWTVTLEVDGLPVHKGATMSIVLRTAIEALQRMRPKFAKMIVRRTIKSTDWQGNPISELPPFRPHLILRDMYTYETDWNETIEHGVDFGSTAPQREVLSFLYVPP
jgi:hypothetical protein